MIIVTMMIIIIMTITMKLMTISKKINLKALLGCESNSTSFWVVSALEWLHL